MFLNCIQSISKFQFQLVNKILYRVVCIYLSLSNIYNYWHRAPYLVPEVISFNLAIILLPIFRCDFISIIDLFKTFSNSNSCPGSLRLLHLKCENCLKFLHIACTVSCYIKVHWTM